MERGNMKERVGDNSDNVEGTNRTSAHQLMNVWTNECGSVCRADPNE